MHQYDAQAERVGILVVTCQMLGALPKFVPEPQPDEKLLEDDESSKGGHVRIAFEFDAWNRALSGVDRTAGNFHFWWPFVLGWFGCRNSIQTQAKGHFQRFFASFCQFFMKLRR